jgi:hypothetical protein
VNDEGMTVRDVGSILGVSFQRVSQLTTRSGVPETGTAEHLRYHQHLWGEILDDCRQLSALADQLGFGEAIERLGRQDSPNRQKVNS